jgi:nicotinate-nucleotide pyrophosphorylase
MKSADNIVELTDKDIKKYTKLKEGTKIEPGDLVYIYDNCYAKLSKGSRVCKEVINKFNTILRKK